MNPNQGKLNRLIKDASQKITAHGHSRARFVRHYTLGIAQYECKDCGMWCDVETGKHFNAIVGNAIEQDCEKPSSEKFDGLE